MPTRTTIIIPCYNEAHRLGESLAQLREHLERSAALNVDVIVVDDGSSDGTAAVAARALKGWDFAQVVRLPWNQGKGGALKVGVAAATGDNIVLMDADLSGDLAYLRIQIEGLEETDIVVGSRMAAGSRVTYASGTRRMMSRLFNVIACTATGVNASDTQCGYKAMRTPVAKLLFHLIETRGFAHDVELLLLADLLGYSVSERGVGWEEGSGSSVSVLRDPWRMLRDVAKTRRFVAQLRSQHGAEHLAACAVASKSLLLVDSGSGWLEPVVDLRPGQSRVVEVS